MLRPTIASLVSFASLVSLAAASCVNDVDDGLALGADDESVAFGGVIVGDLDWVNATSLPANSVARRASRAVAYVTAPEALARCSGFLIAPDVVMTNHHCVPGAQLAANARAHFRYETTWRDDASFVCDEYIGGDAELDYALLRCAGRPGDTFGVLTPDAVSLVEDAPIQLFHQQCDYYTQPTCEPTKKMSPGKITGGIGATRIMHDADMLGGSSGGAIVAAGTTRVVALNNSHVVNTTNGRGTMNLGVPMTAILPHLEAHFPDVIGGDDDDDGDGDGDGGVSTCASVPAAGRVIDEDDDCVTLGGDPRWLRAVEGDGHDGDLVWTGTTASAQPSNYARWELRFDVAGRYEVAAAVDATYGTASVARYAVRHAGGTSTLLVEQTGRTGFVSLGTFDFAAGGGQSVRLDDNTGVRGEQVVFDAVRVRPPSESCPRVRVTAATLNVRPQPNTQQAPVGTLVSGDVVTRVDTVQGQSVNGTSMWYRIERDALAGYVSAAFAICSE